MSLSNSSTSQVRVGVRIRPLTSKESSEGGRAVVEGSPLDRTVAISKRKFTYDSVFHSNITQPQLYDDVAPPLLDAFLNGYNATVLAYGQTGSGKTYTMGSEAHGCEFGEHVHERNFSENDGLIPRFMHDIFASLVHRKDSAGNNAAPNSVCDALVDFRVSASFLEVYGEDIHDLLDEDRKSLPIREDANGEVMVVGLKSTPVVTDAEALNILNTGTLNRTTAATLMNCTSSRSHAVFTVNLEQINRGPSGVDIASCSRFTFVDLAGSERMKKTGAEGERAREGIKINEGLLALGNVINALADEERLAKGEKVHVPYRQSKLTRLLQDALGGNSQTLFLACVSPSNTNASETLSTLQYANRARNIRNAPTRNVDATALELQRLRALTHLLKCELIKHRFDGGASVNSTDPEVERREEDTMTSQSIGVVRQDLFKRPDVIAYMNKIDEKVADANISANINISLSTSSPASRVPLAEPRQMSSPANFDRAASFHAVTSSKPTVIPSPDHNKSGDETDSFVLDVNPDEDMQILDQLLELQHQDNEFNKEQENDQERIDNVSGELEAQETLLLQLRENLKIYHNLKDKYERLMCEVHSLESEKQSLAEELERVQMDPTRGSSVAIKKKLEKVEASLARARSETRKHQQMCRKAEQEAQKCKVLERKIQELKHSKVNLVRKQREAAAKHREFTEQKTREIQSLKRKEKKADKKLTKMEVECQRHKANLERSRSHCVKLSDKLKETETRLMRLLTKRRNELHQRSSASRQPKIASHDVHSETNGMDKFAPLSEEITSIRFLLEKTIGERVTQSQNRQAYDAKVIEYGELMQSLAKEMKILHQIKRKYQPKSSVDNETITSELKDQQLSVEELQFQLEIVENDLEELRVKCPQVDEGSLGDEKRRKTSGSNEPTLKMLSNLEGPALRTVLWGFLESYASSELERRSVKNSLKRKESVFRSFENEVRVRDEKIEALSKKLNGFRKLASSEGKQENWQDDAILTLEKEVNRAKVELNTCIHDKSKLESELALSQEKMLSYQEDYAKLAEKLAISRSQNKMSELTDETASILSKLQDVWADIGMSMDDREIARQKLENCVEDACSGMLIEANQLREDKINAEQTKTKQLIEISAALGLDEDLTSMNNQHQPARAINHRLELLNSLLQQVKPKFDKALERAERFRNEVEALCCDLHPIEDSLSSNLKQILNLRPKSRKIHSSSPGPNLKSSREARAKALERIEGIVNEIEGTCTTGKLVSLSPVRTLEDYSVIDGGNDHPVIEPGVLSDAFLDNCEKDIQNLRLLKSEKLLSNSKKCEQVRSIAREMHVSVRELLSIAEDDMRKWNRDVGSLKNENMTKIICRAISQEGSILVSDAFSTKLDLMLVNLQNLTRGRRLLSDTLKSVIEESHKALLATTCDNEMDVRVLYQSLHDALFHLPPLSKQRIQACIDEMEMLVTAAESVAQSEIETLTVLWEGLNTTSNERGKFWSELEEMTSEAKMTKLNTFERVLEECASDIEEWVVQSQIQATMVHTKLHASLFKLRKVHDEVETLKRKQETKNGIMSLNSELKMSISKLVQLEEKSGSKSRSFTKKNKNSPMREEERLRKNFRSTLATKLGALEKMLQEWEEKEGKIEDADMLSEVVKGMLKNSHRLDAWMEERTRLSHLRTIKSKPRDHQREGVISSYTPTLGAARAKAYEVKNSNERKAYSARSATTNRRVGTSKSPPSVLHQTRDVLSGPRHKKSLLVSTSNVLPPTTVAPRKEINIQAVEPEQTEVLLPFGNLLVDTPSEKENKKF